MTIRRTAIRRTAAAAIIAGTVSIAGAGTAVADHVHSKQVGNGACVLLAQQGGEGDVDLPFASAAQIEANRAHPLHLLVHLGQPGAEAGVEQNVRSGGAHQRAVPGASAS